MKRILLLLCIALLLTACGNRKDPVGGGSSAETETLQQTEPQKPVNQNAVALTFRKENMDTYGDPEKTRQLLLFSYPRIHVEISGNGEAAQTIENELEAEIQHFITGDGEDGDLYASVGQDAASRYAAEAYEEFGDSFLPYAVERSCEVHRADAHVLSLSLTDYINLGGAHPSFLTASLSFDTQTGKRLQLTDLSENPQAFTGFLLTRMVQLAETDGDIAEKINFVEKEEYAEAFSALLRDKSWYLDWDGLVIQSLEYELGAYAAGTVSFKIPYSDLQPYLKAEFLPAPAEKGVLSITETPEYPAAHKLRLADSGSCLFLEAKGMIRELSLIPVEPTGEDLVLHPLHPVFYCGVLQDQAVELTAEVPDTIPNLLVSYCTVDGAEHLGLLSQSGKDGHFFFMNADEFQIS